MVILKGEKKAIQKANKREESTTVLATGITYDDTPEDEILNFQKQLCQIHQTLYDSQYNIICADKIQSTDPWSITCLKLSEEQKSRLQLLQSTADSFLVESQETAKNIEEKKTNNLLENTMTQIEYRESSKSKEQLFISRYNLEGRDVISLPFPGKNKIVKDVKQTIAHMIGIGINTIRLKFGRTILTNEDTLGASGVLPGSSIQLIELSETRSQLLRYERKFEIFRDISTEESPIERARESNEWREALTPKAGFSRIKESSTGVGKRKLTTKPSPNPIYRIRCLDPRRSPMKIPEDGSSSPIYQRVLATTDAKNKFKTCRRNKDKCKTLNTDVTDDCMAVARNELLCNSLCNDWDAEAFARGQAEANGGGVGSEKYQILSAVDGQGGRLVAYSGRF